MEALKLLIYKLPDIIVVIVLPKSDSAVRILKPLNLIVVINFVNQKVCAWLDALSVCFA